MYLNISSYFWYSYYSFHDIWGGCSKYHEVLKCHWKDWVEIVSKGEVGSVDYGKMGWEVSKELDVFLAKDQQP